LKYHFNQTVQNAVIRGKATRDRDKASNRTSPSALTWQGLQNAQDSIVDEEHF
jgi:hypothetical protein